MFPLVLPGEICFVQFLKKKGQCLLTFDFSGQFVEEHGTTLTILGENEMTFDDFLGDFILTFVALAAV